MTDKEKTSKIITGIARKAIEEEFYGTRTGNHDYEDYEEEISELKEKKGCFVTLTKKGSLRGCIGYITSNEPLKKTIALAAKAAAFQDPRFPPLREEELKDIKVEVSVLSKPELLRTNDEEEILKAFKPGITGIIIEEGFNSGLLLPQVFSRDTKPVEAYEMTCRKAGLPTNAWKDPDTRIYLFTATIYEEKDDNK